jgi:phosphosulfolactate phosphohydrolase-like enzyme
MSNYTKSTNFAVKDSLAAGAAAKRVRGTEIDDEFNSLAVAVNSKANTNNAVLTGVPTAPTAASTTNNTQLATTAYTTAAINAIPDAGIGSVVVDGAAGAIGKDIYINTASPTSSDGATGDVWFEY